jgi:hypothetical protein
MSIAKNYCAQGHSSVIPVTNFVFNAAWQKLRLSAGPPGTPWCPGGAGLSYGLPGPFAGRSTAQRGAGATGPGREHS